MRLRGRLLQAGDSSVMRSIPIRLPALCAALSLLPVTYPIQALWNAPGAAHDLEAAFRVGYGERETSLYVAVEV